MDRDIRSTDLYREIEAVCHSFRRPGTGRISDALEVNVSPDGRRAVFAGVVLDKLEGAPSTRVGVVDLGTGQTRLLTAGPNCDRLPRFSADSTRVAFLSDRHRLGDFQLYLLDLDSGAVRSTPAVTGWVEYMHWSPDGSRILLGVAGHGADVSGGQGAIVSKVAAESLPSWMPTVETGDEDHRWRNVWIYDVDANRLRSLDLARVNIWEAVWCGNDALAVVASPEPGEGAWYDARLHTIQVETGRIRCVYTPQDQLGWPAASPSGKHLAFVQGLCSDRWIVAGELSLLETISGKVSKIDTHDVDVTYAEWRSESRLLLAGHRGHETVVGILDVESRTFSEVWVSSHVTTGGRYVSVSGFGDSGNCVLVGESFVTSPEIAIIRDGEYRPVVSFDVGYTEWIRNVATVEPVRWKSPDEMEVQGWLVRPRHGAAPHPLVVMIHGGPVGHWRSTWMFRSSVLPAFLAKHGFAMLLPNPRGSAGRGQSFTRAVLGDLGGVDARDILAGVDALTERGLADQNRLGVTGISYGGFMTSWLVTQDARFAAAVSVAPHTNQVTERLLSNIPRFVDIFLADKYNNVGGKYFERSPVMHADKAKTPTLNICGALDRCTPPEEAVQFHRALLDSGVTSVLVVYPEEGHGIRHFPASIDYAARVVSWFERYL